MTARWQFKLQLWRRWQPSGGGEMAQCPQKLKLRMIPHVALLEAQITQITIRNQTMKSLGTFPWSLECIVIFVFMLYIYIYIYAYIIIYIYI